MPELILASTSPARRALLDGLGVPYFAEAPGVEETLPPGIDVRASVAMLARRKAEAVAARHPGAWVLGADQLLSLDGEAIGKPLDRDAARAQLSRLLGRTHEILTGVCLLGTGAPRETVQSTRLTFFALSNAELERYLDLDEWRGCAGSYRIEGRGQALLSDIQGDRTNVQGLPMLPVATWLREAGMKWF